MKNVFEREIIIEKNYIYGNVDFNNFFKIPKEMLPIVIKNISAEKLDLKTCVTLDIETTNNAAYTVPFMIGLVYFDKDNFKLRQVYITDLDAEYLFLKTVANIFEQFTGFITYNGTEFDLPVIAERFKTHSIPYDFTQKQNIDALFGARKLWRKKLKRRNLLTVEREILNVTRYKDIRSADIPYAFQEGLEENKNLLEAILKHNYWDVLSTFSVLIRIGEILAMNELFLGTDEILAIGKLCSSKGLIETANKFLRKMKDYPAWVFEVYQGLMLLAKNLKKLNEKNELYEVCKQIVDSAEITSLSERYGKFEPFPYETLATHYEQETHEYSKALNILSEAYQIAEKFQNSRIKKLQRRIAYIKNLLERKKDDNKELSSCN